MGMVVGVSAAVGAGGSVGTAVVATGTGVSAEVGVACADGCASAVCATHWRASDCAVASTSTPGGEAQADSRDSAIRLMTARPTTGLIEDFIAIIRDSPFDLAPVISQGLSAQIISPPGG
jgi:hypothetical protein